MAALEALGDGIVRVERTGQGDPDLDLNLDLDLKPDLNLDFDLEYRGGRQQSSRREPNST